MSACMNIYQDQEAFYAWSSTSPNWEDIELPTKVASLRKSASNLAKAYAVGKQVAGSMNSRPGHNPFLKPTLLKQLGLASISEFRATKMLTLEFSPDEAHCRLFRWSSVGDHTVPDRGVAEVFLMDQEDKIVGEVLSFLDLPSDARTEEHVYVESPEPIAATDAGGEFICSHAARDLIEQLVVGPAEVAQDKLFENTDVVVWIDWREADDDIVAYFSSHIPSGELLAEWDRDSLFIKYANKRMPVLLNFDPSDRDVTIRAVNGAILPDHEIRFIKASAGGDTLAFMLLPREVWSRVDSHFGRRAERAFEPVNEASRFFS